MEKLAVNHGHQKGVCYREIRLCIVTMDIILGSIVKYWEDLNDLI